MNNTWLVFVTASSWLLTLVGGLGWRALDHFNGKRLEAYCRLKRQPSRFGEILDNQERAVAAAQHVTMIGTVLCSLCLGVLYVKQSAVQKGVLPSPPSVSWALGCILLMILASVWLPRLTIRFSSTLFLYHTWPLWKALAVAVSPLTMLSEGFAWLGQRLNDEPDNQEFEEEMLEDEIRTMVTAGQREGVFSEGIPEMIQGVMNLDENDVEEIMTPRSLVDMLDIDLAWEDVVKTVVDCGRTRLPVYQGTSDNIVGILFVKDLLSLLVDPNFQPGPSTLQSILRNPWFIPGGKPVDELLRVFLHNRNHMAIVLDDYQQFVGVVTIEDALEEIVGEIADELDVDEESEIIYDELSHKITAEGKVPIDSLSKLLGLELPESDDYDTIGGLIVHRLTAIPKTGTVLDLPGIRLTVLKANRRAVQRVLIELSHPPTEA